MTRMLYDDTKPLYPELMVPQLSFLDLPLDALHHIEGFFSMDDLFQMIRLAEPHINHYQAHEYADLDGYHPIDDYDIDDALEPTSLFQ